jgi:RNA polymerase sigma-70 factor (ECF subfamily)
MEADESLVKRTLQGDPAAFGELYDRYAGVIRAACFDTTLELNSAQDLAQEVFLRAFVKLPTLRQSDRFGPWLISISRHVCQEWRRSRRRDRHTFTSDPPEISESTNSDSVDTSSEIRLAIAQLPERERLALHLFYLQQQSAEEARGILGLSYSAFYKVVARAKQRLTKLLSGQAGIKP